MRTADYTPGKWLELGLGLSLGSGLGLCQGSVSIHMFIGYTLYVPQLHSPHFTRGQWLNGTIRTINS